MKLPLILEIKGNSLDDGPGIRSVVFVKGCPLSCLWCHNPESKNTGLELSWSARDCIGCGKCIAVCPQKAIDKKNEFFIDRKKCDLCLECAKVCPSKALSRVGEERSVEELLDIILKDKVFFDTSGGGVTLSGGEISMFPEFAGALLKELKLNGIHTLIESCGYFDYKTFCSLMLPFVDSIYYDLKIYEPSLHKKYCGTDNRIILENFAKLFALSKSAGFEILPRIPLIPGITDSKENLSAIAEFLHSQSADRVQLLPYNPSWTEKPGKLGFDHPSGFDAGMGWQSIEELSECESIFLKKGIETL